MDSIRLSRLAPAIIRALAGEIIWDWDLATSRIWFSEAMCDLWGHDTAQAEVDAGWFEQRVHLDDRAGVMLSFQEAVARKERWSAEFRFARADESFSHVLVRGTVITDLRREPVRVAGVMFDMTERLILQQQLEQVRRIRGEEVPFEPGGELAP
jgi:phosphoserine phosphatase RsbU/P